MYGTQCRMLSTTEDQHINRRMGQMNIEEFVDHYRYDASTPQELDALAFQFLCCARRSTHKDVAKAWKNGWKMVSKDAEDARTRLTRHPSPETHPGFFSNRSVGKPGHLDDDLYLPMVFRLDLTGIASGKVHTGIYETPLSEDKVYRVGLSRDINTYVTPLNGSAIKVPTKTLRGLLNMGRMVALPLSCFAKAA